MIIRRRDDIRSSEITPESVYVDRRKFLKAGAAGVIGLAGLAPAALAKRHGDASAEAIAQEKLNTYEEITNHNNFYEFGTDKQDPARYAPGMLKTEPWTIRVEGHCAKPGTFQLEDFLKPHTVQDRVYRLRCVEAWSMVIPWRGIPLNEVIKRAEPTSAAKYVEMFTLLDPEQMPLQRTNLLDWPYNEGLRMDEATHPLTLLVTGLYGRELPAQNGAPLRLIVPWKYGFKSIKSIVRMRFVEEQPRTSWMKSSPNEYGFYANVNPNVDHPRWSQERERRLPGLFKNTPTQMFNGYGEQVERLYRGMDLRRYF